MSIHPSLSSSDKNKKQGSVLKRSERLRIMLEKGQWKEGDDVYGLPKIKTIRIKIKKEKAAAEKVGATATEGAAGPAAAEAAAPEPKEQSSAKSQGKK